MQVDSWFSIPSGEADGGFEISFLIQILRRNQRHNPGLPATTASEDEEPGRCKPGCPSLPLAETTSVK